MSLMKPGDKVAILFDLVGLKSEKTYEGKTVIETRLDFKQGADGIMWLNSSRSIIDLTAWTQSLDPEDIDHVILNITSDHLLEPRHFEEMPDSIARIGRAINYAVREAYNNGYTRIGFRSRPDDSSNKSDDTEKK